LHVIVSPYLHYTSGKQATQTPQRLTGMSALTSSTILNKYVQAK